MGTLPAVISPDRTVYTIVETNSGTYADLAIQPGGQIDVIDARSPLSSDLGYLSLEGITYQPSASAGPRGISLTRRGDGVAVLRKPRTLELVVFTLGRHAHRLGVVTLGHAAQGLPRLSWGLRLARRRLSAGTYLVELVGRLGVGARATDRT
ncbi:MAG TPA: hypothetical protein VGI55_18565 [Solirubrobacteraceae bacterium]